MAQKNKSLWEQMFGSSQTKSARKESETEKVLGNIFYDAPIAGGKAIVSGAKKAAPHIKKVGSAAQKVGEFGASLNWGGDSFELPNFDPFGSGGGGYQSQTTATQRVEQAKLEKKAMKLVHTLGVSKSDAIEYIRTHPQTKLAPTPKKQNKPQYKKQFPHPYQESEQQRLARERKRYDELLRQNVSPSYALMTIERERTKR